MNFQCSETAFSPRRGRGLLCRRACASYSEEVNVNRLEKFAALSTLSAVLFTGVAIAQDDHRDDHRDDHHDDARNADHHDHDNHAYVHHDEWKKGYRMDHDNWDRGERVDYHAYHLKRPPRGYEWRLLDGNYVLGAVDNGIIASVVIAPDHDRH
jgi:Ni/Co efflux regulator RcnB